MGLKSANLHRSTEQLREDKAAVLEQNSSDVAPATSSRRSEKKAQARQGEPAPPPSTAADDVEALYIEHRTLLLYVACRKFRIPDCDAENLIQEVFLSFLQTGTKIDNVRAWLVESGFRPVEDARALRPAV